VAGGGLQSPLCPRRISRGGFHGANSGGATLIVPLFPAARQRTPVPSATPCQPAPPVRLLWPRVYARAAAQSRRARGAGHGSLCAGHAGAVEADAGSLSPVPPTRLHRRGAAATARAAQLLQTGKHAQYICEWWSRVSRPGQRCTLW